MNYSEARPTVATRQIFSLISFRQLLTAFDCLPFERTNQNAGVESGVVHCGKAAASREFQRRLVLFSEGFTDTKKVHNPFCCLISVKVWESPPSRINDGKKHEVPERQREGGGEGGASCIPRDLLASLTQMHIIRLLTYCQ